MTWSLAARVVFAANRAAARFRDPALHSTKLAYKLQ
jgi:hypothetical protein